jgi:Response regulators consisting of a CheY-like receiver domain and a winged-helix DNA-binding domain
MAKKILIVEDEPKIVEAVEAYLKKDGYLTYVALDGKTALELFAKIRPDMIILDLMLPIVSGEEVCKMIRKQSRVPIIMLTAKTYEDDKIIGLKLGADDYITKPYSPRELLARIEAIFRRCADDLTPLFDVMSWNEDDLEVNFSNMTLKKQGNIVNLTPNEFKLFSALAKYPKKVFTREELIEIAFGLDFAGFDRTIDSHIKNLRAKIETDQSSPLYILTVRGVGYKFGGESE